MHCLLDQPNSVKWQVGLHIIIEDPSSSLILDAGYFSNKNIFRN
jgi:hypothetical protein